MFIAFKGSRSWNVLALYLEATDQSVSVETLPENKAQEPSAANLGFLSNQDFYLYSI